MSPTATRRFRVLIEERTTWEIIVEATDANAAEENALDILVNVGVEHFTHKDGSIGMVLSEEVPS